MHKTTIEKEKELDHFEPAQWVYEQTVGETVLTIGMEQVNYSVFLEGETKKLTCLFGCYEAFSKAQRLLAKEPSQLKTSVELSQNDLLVHKFYDQTFQTIIFSDILEHVPEPEKYIAAALKLLNDTGRIVIIVPYGRTENCVNEFYFTELQSLVESLSIINMKFIYTSIGIVCERKVIDEIGLPYYSELAEDLELVFSRKETDYLNEIRVWKSKLIEQKEATIKLLEQQVKRSEIDMEILNDFHVQTLEKQQNLHELTVLKKKYQSLSTSKLGRVTLYMWKLRKKIKRVSK